MQSAAWCEADIQSRCDPEVTYLDCSEGWFTLVAKQYFAVGQLPPSGAKLKVAL